MSGRDIAETKGSPSSWSVVTLKPASEWCPAAGGGVMHLTKGSGYWISASGCLMIESGDILLTAGASSGKLRVSRLSPAKVNYLAVSVGDLAAAVTNEHAALIDRLWRTGSQKIRHVPAQSPAASQFRGLLHGAARGNRQKAVPTRMLHWLVRQIDPDCQLELVARPSGASESAQQRLTAWLATFNREELSSMSVVELAKRYGCSGRHLSRLFHREFGVSVRQRQIALRMEAARELLRNDRLRVIEVALGCGYRNLGLFNASFKAAHGQTPSQWRRQALTSEWATFPGKLVAGNSKETGEIVPLHPIVTAGTSVRYAQF